MKKILYILGSDPMDKRSWSGTCYSCYEQLQRFYEVEVISIQPDRIDKIINWAYGVLRKFTSINRTYSLTHLRSKRACNRLNKILKTKCSSDYQGIFLIGMHLGAYIKTEIPIMSYQDATANLLVGYYEDFPISQSKSANELEKRRLDNARWALFASEWAKNSAIEDYNISPDKCFVGKLGANVDTTNFQHSHDSHIRNLLFVGVDWKRKGGDIAVECLRELTKLDPTKKYVLHLVGVKPPYDITDENIKVYGFLNRNIPEQQNLMITLREKADLFLLPTKAECAGIVFCEASAYGLPSITYDTGGIGSYVIDGENGYKLPIGSDGKDFAHVIIKVFEDPQRLNYMKSRSVEMYKQDMNWNNLGDFIHSKLG